MDVNEVLPRFSRGGFFFRGVSPDCYRSGYSMPDRMHLACRPSSPCALGASPFLDGHLKLIGIAA